MKINISVENYEKLKTFLRELGIGYSISFDNYKNVIEEIMKINPVGTYYSKTKGGKNQ